MMFKETLNLELIGEVSIYLGIGFQVITAVVLGGLVGLDREIKMKAAGLKTNILICLGATLYTTISMLVIKDMGGPVDPNRVGAQIVSGIGFLGAGAIFQGKGNITGLTTAATIWAVAAIGYTIGSGYPISAILFTLTVLLVLKLIRPIEGAFERKKDFKNFDVEVLSFGTVRSTILDIIEEHEIDAQNLSVEEINDSKGRIILSFSLFCHRRRVERILGEIETILKVEKTSFRRLKN